MLLAEGIFGIWIIFVVFAVVLTMFAAASLVSSSRGRFPFLPVYAMVFGVLLIAWGIWIAKENTLPFLGLFGTAVVISIYSFVLFAKRRHSTKN
jgi:hypothetical protein